MGNIVGGAQRAEDVARLQAGRGTRRARGERGVLHRHEERLALDVRKREVYTTWVAAFRCRGPVAEDVRAAGGYPLDEALREGGDAGVVVLMRVSDYSLQKEPPRRGWGEEDAPQYPCTRSHRRAECTTPARGCRKHPAPGLEERNTQSACNSHPCVLPTQGHRNGKKGGR